MTFGNRLAWAFVFAVNYTYLYMPKSAAKAKSARDTLLESVTRIREEARRRMSEDEFRQVEEKVHELANKVRASRGRKRETA